MQGKKHYILLNNNYLLSDEPSINHSNRAFRYGDGLFETIYASGTEPQFLDLHVNRLHQGMRVLKMQIPGFLHRDYLKRNITSLLQKNRYYGGARVKLTVYRDGIGLFTPETNEIGVLVESSELEFDKYTLNEKGYTIGIFKEVVKPNNILSNIKHCNALIYILAGLHKKEHAWDECMILNEKLHLCESISSNLFLLKDKQIYTPALEEGCVAGTMRQTMLELLQNTEYTINANASLTVQDLLLADEVFLTNAINGIRWVLAFEKKRYYNRVSKMLINKLNERAFPA